MDCPPGRSIQAQWNVAAGYGKGGRDKSGKEIVEGAEIENCKAGYKRALIMRIKAESPKTAIVLVDT